MAMMVMTALFMAAISPDMSRMPLLLTEFAVDDAI
jgi:hypothetical protein